MADHRTEDRVDLAPADAPVRAEYMRDFYSWLMEQARAVREGCWGAVDRDNLAEEIESLGGSSSTSWRARFAFCWCIS
jgi:hypothetical protein